MNCRSLTALAAALLIVAAAWPSTAIAAGGANGAAKAKTSFTTDGVYIVQMADRPIVAYDGAIQGYKATKPEHGKKIDPAAKDVARYAGYLAGRHDEALKSVGAAGKLYSYTYTFDGFAARLTAAQANKLSGMAGVLSVEPDAMYQADTSDTPTFLGLDAPGGLWDQLGGVGSAGEDIIIGVIDSGIWPESASFSDRTGLNGSESKSGKLSYHHMPIWHGKCQGGEAFNASNCNQKLIGARYYNAGWASGGLSGNEVLNRDRPWEFLSPRDYNGHGTHTSSTAGGNNGVPTTGPAAAFGTISGMAPRARIAMYKALWSTQDASVASGTGSDLVAAIDQAVADGVDVINYSVSGTTTNFLDAVEISFLFAADAGIFVAASAGNDGPTTGTVAHPGPWLTTVAAGTHNRNGIGSVTLGNSTTYNGASIATAVGPAPLIDSTAAGMAGADPTAVALCFSTFTNGGSPALDPAKVAGKIVVCDRGVSARVDKSLAVKEAGGVGMILVNTSPNSINADFHFVPSVHLQDTDRAAVKAYAATAGATATINAATITFSDPAPFTASFSSRGPLAAGAGDLLKPDVIAPGQDVLAAVAPPGNAGLDFNLYSGTSMSSPHVAGLAALLKDLHPDWSPMMIKSALMTSASDILDGPNTNPLVIFRQGAGHVRPNSAADPGLVYDSGFLDWLAFLCATTNGVSASDCALLASLGFPTRAIDFNGPSIAIGALAGVDTIHRTVTNVGSGPATYAASVSGLVGVTAVVSPASFTINPGESKSYSVTFTVTSAALNAYVGGQLTWAGGGHSVRSPIVVRPVALAAPAEVSGSASGISYSVKAGFAGTLDFAARGLVAAATTAASVSADPDQTFNPNDATGTYSQSFSVAAGTSLLRVGIDEGFITPSGTDLDVYLFRGTTFVGQAADGDSNEMVTLANPTAGTYTIFVHGFNTNGPSADFTLFDWQVPTSSSGNMTVPASTATTIGGSVPVNLTFSGLTAGTWYLGQVAYGNPGAIGSTIVSVR